MKLLRLITNAHRVLGMNARNLSYIRPLNLSSARAIADDKIESKRVLRRAGVPVPRLIATIASHDALDTFDFTALPDSFVLKPNRGFGGGGIIVLFARKKGRRDAWVKADGSVITAEDLRAHVYSIVDGAFSLAGVSDIAVFEERLTLLKLFRPYAYRGIPDLRIIVYNRVPVMAMLRLPTRESGGKANLQLGGIGVGIDMASGTTTSAIHGKGRLIEYVPGTRMPLSGIKIPHWDDILTLAVKAQEASGLGFLGADVVVDRERGPVFLELNARPGLSIQIANLAGLKERLQRVEGLAIKNVAHGVRIGKDLFGGEIEEALERSSGKRVIGSVERVTFIGKDNKEVTVEAKIDTGAYSTSIDRALARELGFGATLDAFDAIDIREFVLAKKGDGVKAEKAFMEKYGAHIQDLADVATVWSSSGVTLRPVVKIPFVMDGRRVPARVNVVDRGNLRYPAIIGKRNLHKFLVDVSK